jgi:hypothetical protein
MGTAPDAASREVVGCLPRRQEGSAVDTETDLGFAP